MLCPKCGKDFRRLLALSRDDHKTQICSKCGSLEAIEAIEKITGRTKDTDLLRSFIDENGNNPTEKMDPRARTEAAVRATGNKWAIENFNATHN